MPTAIPKRLFPPICSVLFLLMLFQMGCYLPKRFAPKRKPLPTKMGKIAVVGFKPAMSIGKKPGIIRSVISGAVFMAEPVPQRAVNNMTTALFEKLLKDDGHDLISPHQVKGVFQSIISSNPSMRDIDVFQKIGKIFSADAVLVGYLYRWRERDGTDYSVNLPASVAFDLYLIGPENKAILWKGKYDETQKSLSENLFDTNTFVKGGGKWLTAERLAELALMDIFGK